MQCYAVNESDYGKASMTVHEGKEVTGSVQYSPINKSDCGKAIRIGHEGK